MLLKWMEEQFEFLERKVKLAVANGPAAASGDFEALCVTKIEEKLAAVSRPLSVSESNKIAKVIEASKLSAEGGVDPTTPWVSNGGSTGGGT